MDTTEQRIKIAVQKSGRLTDHSRDLVPFKVTPSGLKVYVGEKVF